jgi:hypothetical protein
VVGILAYYARGRGLDSRTMQTFVCMNMSVCIGSGCFFMYKYVFTKKMDLSIYLSLISSLISYRIHNTSLKSAYFKLDSRKWKCLEYWSLFINLIYAMLHIKILLSFFLSKFSDAFPPLWETWRYVYVINSNLIPTETWNWNFFIAQFQNNIYHTYVKVSSFSTVSF